MLSPIVIIVVWIDVIVDSIDISPLVARVSIALTESIEITDTVLVNFFRFVGFY